MGELAPNSVTPNSTRIDSELRTPNGNGERTFGP